METISNTNANKIKELASKRMRFKSSGVKAMLKQFESNETIDDQAVKILTVAALFELVNEVRLNRRELRTTRKIIEKALKTTSK